MSELLHEAILDRATTDPDALALRFQGDSMTYGELAAAVSSCASALLRLGLERSDRVAVYLPKCLEAVTAMYGPNAAGGAFVPINPLLKPRQVAYILRDCGVRFLVTSYDRFQQLRDDLQHCPTLHAILLVGEPVRDDEGGFGAQVLGWNDAMGLSRSTERVHRCIATDIAAILYTSGSTGNPKGVVLTHQNMRLGAQAAAKYLENHPGDLILSVLSLSFDAGLVQVTGPLEVGAGVVLLDYLLPRDVVRAVARERITGLAGVPPLWIELAGLEWPEATIDHLRYITNSGGALPVPVIKTLRGKLPRTSIYLHYGLTEAFRSTYLAPDQIDSRPTSMGKAMPYVEVMVVREDGSLCEAHEPGELVHRGPLVSLGYWNDPKKTAERFRPVPGAHPEVQLPEIAVWSGDTVKMDEEGYLYFIGRKDEMIKTSGYRVSPTEVEEVLFATGLVEEAVVVGMPDEKLGQRIVAIVKPSGAEFTPSLLLKACREQLANFMVPAQVVERSALPRSPNGKIDRMKLAAELSGGEGHAE